MVMFPAAGLVSLTLAAVASAQQVGTQTAETHPAISWQKCTAPGSCTTVSGSVTLDANWRWTHTTQGYTNCYTGNTWDTTICPDGETCAANCALEGADYSGTYGITTSGNALKLNFITNGAQKNVGSRVYLMADDSTYEMFKLLNQEFTFDVDVSGLPCGLNGALYFSEMDADGGMSKHPTNKAGAKYGTGYCDSQCPRDIKFINGVANSDGWVPDSNSANSGKGTYGSCCNEMDVWEANSISAAYTPHPCSVEGQTRCEGTDCGIDDRYSGLCDPDGCDFNSYRMGNKTFYGEGGTGVDTRSKFTVVTQFITADNTTSGALSEIRRLYVQNGKVIQNSAVAIDGIDPVDSITDNYCNQQKTKFGGTNSFANKGGLAGIAKSFANGVVLVMSLWDDYTTNMLWLDSTYPTDSDPSTPGVGHGTCPTNSGVPAEIESSAASASVTFSNIKFGPIGSTYSSTGGTGSYSSSGSVSAPSASSYSQSPSGGLSGSYQSGARALGASVVAIVANTVAIATILF